MRSRNGSYPKPRPGNLDGDGGHVAIYPLLLRAVRGTGRHEQWEEVTDHDEDGAQEDATGKRRRYVRNLTGKRRGAVERIQIPEQVVEEAPPEHTADAPQRQGAGEELGVIVEEVLRRFVHGTLEPLAGIDLR